jgi:hypothetical protein
MAEAGTCQMCDRTLRKGTTQHHLIPRTCHRNRWFQKRFSREEMRVTVDLCGDCHRAVHRLVPCEKNLGRHYSTLDLLKSHPAIAKYITWVRKQR